jgi:hypothetical protein
MGIAFHNNEKLKKKYIQIVEQHAKNVADNAALMAEISQYQLEHCKNEEALGIPSEIVLLKKLIIEMIPSTFSEIYTLNFLGSIPIGKDLKDVHLNFSLRILNDKEKGVVNFTKEEPLVRSTIKKIENRINGLDVFYAPDAVFLACDAAHVVSFAVSQNKSSINSDRKSYFDYRPRHFGWMFQVLLEELAR